MQDDDRGGKQSGRGFHEGFQHRRLRVQGLQHHLYPQLPSNRPQERPSAMPRSNFGIHPASELTMRPERVQMDKSRQVRGFQAR